jgi:hypothetical protein
MLDCINIKVEKKKQRQKGKKKEGGFPHKKTATSK